MSIETMAVVLHHSSAKGTDKLVLLGIANHAGDGGAWPTVETLARYANVTERAVQKALGKLVDLGELVVHRQAGGTSDLHAWQRPNRYDVTVACPATCDHSPNHRPRRLPAAPADLWTDGVNPSSPGEPQDTRGVNPTTPGGVNPSSPKPSTQPLPNHRGLSTTDRARQGSGFTPPCSECSAPNLDVCRARQANLHADDRHDYVPVRRAAS